jgi:hypothetical protein
VKGKQPHYSTTKKRSAYLPFWLLAVLGEKAERASESSGREAGQSADDAKAGSQRDALVDQSGDDIAIGGRYGHAHGAGLNCGGVREEGGT